MNVLPFPSALSTSIRPSSSCTSIRTMDNPSPKPSSPCAPGRRVNSWKIRSRSPGSIPFPVSITESFKWLPGKAESPFGTKEAVSVMPPSEVNFTALESRLLTIWRKRNGSLIKAPFSSGSISHFKDNPLAEVSGSKLT